MSYDVGIVDPKTKDVLTLDRNYTWNLSSFFSIFGVHPYQDMRGKQAAEVDALITTAFGLIQQHDLEALHEKYDPKPDPVTGEQWGDVEGAIEFLHDIQADCRAFPRGLVTAD